MAAPILASTYCAMNGTDDSAGWATAQAAAVAAGVAVVVDGYLNVFPFASPAGLKQIRCRAGGRINILDSTYSPGQILIDVSACPGIELKFMRVRAMHTCFDDSVVCTLEGVDEALVDDWRFEGSCAYGFMARKGLEIEIKGARFRGYNGGVDVALYFDAYNGALEDCTVDAIRCRGIFGYGAVISGGRGHTISNGNTNGNVGASFPFCLAQCVNSSALNNKSVNSPYESCNFTNTNYCLMDGARGTWDNSHGQDFAFSFHGSDPTIKSRHNRATNLHAVNSYKSAFGIADYAEYNEVCDSTFVNCGVRSTAAGVLGGGSSGVVCYTGMVGAVAWGNAFRGNNLSFETGSVLNVGTEEGSAAFTTFEDNNVVGSYTNRYVLASASALVFEKDWLAYTAVVTSKTGTLTTVGTVTAEYLRRGKMYQLLVTVPITANGSGGGAVVVSLPFATTRGAFGGREDGLTGQSLNGKLLSNTVEIRNDDNAYPGGSGALLIVEGLCKAA